MGCDAATCCVDVFASLWAREAGREGQHVCETYARRRVAGASRVVELGTLDMPPAYGQERRAGREIARVRDVCATPDNWREQSGGVVDS